MKYIQGQNANIYGVYADIITFLQSLGWTLLRQDNEAHNITYKFGDGKTTFMRSKQGDVIYLRVSGRSHDTYWIGEDLYVIDIGHYVGEYSSSSVAPSNSGDSFSSITPQTFFFIETEANAIVKEYMVFADDRSIITRFSFFGYDIVAGGVLSYVMKTNTSFVGGALLWAARRGDDYWRPYGIAKAYTDLYSVGDFYAKDLTQINNGQSFIRPLFPIGFFYPYKNAFKNDNFIPFMRIYVFYSHTDNTTRSLGYLEDMFYVPKNGLKQGEILIRGGAKYMIVDLNIDNFCLAVKIDD